MHYRGHVSQDSQVLPELPLFLLSLLSVLYNTPYIIVKRRKKNARDLKATISNLQRGRWGFFLSQEVQTVKKPPDRELAVSYV